MLIPKENQNARKIPKAKSRRSIAEQLSGRWKITEMPDFEEGFLSETKNPHVNLSVNKSDLSLSGDFEFSLDSGELDGEVILQEESPGKVRILFSFEGTSETDAINGYGEATLSDDGRTLAGKLCYHGQDRYRFVWRRVQRCKSKSSLTQ